VGSPGDLTARQALAYATPATKRLFLGLLRSLWSRSFYDAMRFVKNVGLSESTVHVCDLPRRRAPVVRFERQGHAASRCTTGSGHATPWLDVVSAIPYGTFLWVVVGYSISCSCATSQRSEVHRGFLALNVRAS